MANIGKVKDAIGKVKDTIGKVKDNINKVKVNFNEGKLNLRVPKYVRPLAKATGVPVSKANIMSTYSCK